MDRKEYVKFLMESLLKIEERSSDNDVVRVSNYPLDKIKEPIRVRLERQLDLLESEIETQTTSIVTPEARTA